jgi:ADP-ribose pyrophosphatase YjhB (NUDIX family)
MTNKVRRFSELRPDRVDSNLFQYHLKKLLTDGYVAKMPGGYTLSGRGLYYADRHSGALKGERLQPKIIVVLIVRDSEGRALIIRKPRQPFLGSYHLPAGKVHDGENVETAARRELTEKTGLNPDKLTYSTTAHVIIRQNEEIISEYYGIVMRGVYDGEPEIGQWYAAGDGVELCPSVAEMLGIPEIGAKGFYEWELTA